MMSDEPSEPPADESTEPNSNDLNITIDWGNLEEAEHKDLINVIKEQRSMLEKMSKSQKEGDKKSKNAEIETVRKELEKIKAEKAEQEHEFEVEALQQLKYPVDKIPKDATLDEIKMGRQMLQIYLSENRGATFPRLQTKDQQVTHNKTKYYNFETKKIEER